MYEPFVGAIFLWAPFFVPRDYMLCDGTVLNVHQNQVLFVLLGNKYGGDGVNTFAVPDFRKRMPLGSTNMTAIGGVTGDVTQPLGSGNVSIGLNNLPPHAHSFSGSTISVSIPANDGGGSSSNTDTPGPTAVLTKGTVVSGPVNTTSKQYTTASANTNLKPFDVNLSGANTGITGGGQPLNLSVNIPTLTVNFIIAATGLFPPRP